jgi:cysteine desulfurase
VISTYLDYNATAPVRPEAAEAVACALRIGGNPSSVHANGRLARAAVEKARGEVAALVGVKPGSITFTSGGTEANALAVQSAVAAGSKRLIVGAADHPSLIEGASATGVWTELWPVEGDGIADLGWLRERLGAWKAADGRPFVALSLANGETGVIQPAAEIAAMVHEAGGWLHLDAVQAAGKIPVDFSGLGADTMALSAHKLGGPQGVGALVAGTRATVARRQFGGGQESGRRAGTENVPGIAGFGAAASAALLRDLPRMAAMSAWRDGLAARVKEAGAVVLGEGAERLPQTLCFAAPGFGSELQVMNLDLAGVMVSAGSACSSGKVKASPVVEAMGRADLAPYSLRVSGGWASTAADWKRCGDVWTEAYVRALSRKRELA